MQLQTFNTSLGAQLKTIYSVDGLGTNTNFFIAGPLVLYFIQANYTGTAGIFLTIYDTGAVVGATGGPALAATQPTGTFYLKATQPLEFSTYGAAFTKGALFVVSATIDANGHPSGVGDALPALTIGYAAMGYA